MTVMVPALVEEKSGEIAYDLSASDFSIRDNGVEQEVGLEGDTDLQGRSLLLVIQTGRNAQLAKIGQLSELLDAILTGPRDQVAIMTFDSRPHVVQEFGVNSDAIAHSLAFLPPGDSGAMLFDALHAGVALFDRAPVDNRRVILLISGEHDHGSIASGAGSLIQSVSLANVSIYGLTFIAPRKQLMGRLWSMNPLTMTGSAMQRNAPETLAQLTGGDFYRFDTERGFEDRVSDITNHIHNSYYLTFRPSNPTPGFHSLQVSVRRVKTNVISARSGYWLSPVVNVGSEGNAQ